MRARHGSGRSPHGWHARTLATACRAACRAACMWQAARGMSRLSQVAPQVQTLHVIAASALASADWQICGINVLTWSF